MLRTSLLGCFVTARLTARHDGGWNAPLDRRHRFRGQFGGTEHATHGAGKAGIKTLTRAMTVAFAPHRILVTCATPGPRQGARTAHGPRQRTALLDRVALKRYAILAEIARRWPWARRMPASAPTMC